MHVCCCLCASAFTVWLSPCSHLQSSKSINCLTNNTTKFRWSPTHTLNQYTSQLINQSIITFCQCFNNPLNEVYTIICSQRLQVIHLFLSETPDPLQSDFALWRCQFLQWCLSGLCNISNMQACIWHVHTHTHTQTQTHTDTHTHTRTCTHTHTRARMRAITHARIHAHMHSDSCHKIPLKHPPHPIFPLPPSLLKQTLLQNRGSVFTGYFILYRSSLTYLTILPESAGWVFTMRMPTFCMQSMHTLSILI